MSVAYKGKGVSQGDYLRFGVYWQRVLWVLLRSRKLGINPTVFVHDDEKQVGKSIYALSYHRDQSAEEFMALSLQSLSNYVKLT